MIKLFIDFYRMAIMFPQHSFLYDFLPRIRNFIASAPPVASPHTCCHPPPPPFVMPLGLGPICKGMSKLWCLLFQQGNISNVPSLKDYRIPATCSPWPRPTQRAGGGVSFQRYIPSLSLSLPLFRRLFLKAWESRFKGPNLKGLAPSRGALIPKE